MQKLLTAVAIACFMTGCVTAGSDQPHADSPGATKRDQGPALCRDGTAPPCTNRS